MRSLIQKKGLGGGKSEIESKGEDHVSSSISARRARLQAYKEISATELPVHIITLDGLDPLLYAARKAIGPLQLTEEEARNTARRAYEKNTWIERNQIVIFRI